MGCGRDEERDGGGQRQEERGLERAVLAVHRRCVIAGAQAAAELRQQHHTDGNADDAKRKLKQPVGVIEPGHHAVLQRGDDGVEHHGELVHAAGDEARCGEHEQPAHIGIEARQAEGEAHLRFRRGNGDDDHLQDARRGDAPGERHRRAALLDVADGDQRNQHGDEHDVEQARRESGDGKAAKRVQHAGIERDQRHAEEKGKRDARQKDGKLELRRIGGKAWREQQHEPGHDEFAERW